MSMFVDFPLINEDEEFRQLSMFPLYDVSNYGRVMRRGNTPLVSKARLLSIESPYDDYSNVKLSQNGKTTRIGVHRLVALAFLGDAKGLEVNHKNGNKKDNRLSNLEYVTKSQNAIHAYKLGLITRKGENNSKAKLTNANVIEIFSLRHLMNNRKAAKEVSEKYNVGRRIIRQIWDQTRWKHLTDTLLS